jgi:hypothetical protein
MTPQQLEASFKKMCADTMSQVVVALADKYGFDQEEANRFLASNDIKIPEEIFKSLIKACRVQCPHCSNTYAGKGGLKQHTDKFHTEPDSEPKYPCLYCYTNHACSSNLARHMLSCKNSPDYIKPSEGKFLCEECADKNIHQAFKQKGNLKQHISTRHT